MQPVNPTSPRRISLWLVLPAIFAAVYATHLTLLRLPYYWDECAYYIPAAYDFFQSGTIIRQSAVANIHPPLPSILLATPGGTSSASLPSPPAPSSASSPPPPSPPSSASPASLAGPAVATVTTLLTALYPIWFAQSTLAHADIFAAAFTLWALSFYLAETPGAPSLPKVRVGSSLPQSEKATSPPLSSSPLPPSPKKPPSSPPPPSPSSNSTEPYPPPQRAKITSSGPPP